MNKVLLISLLLLSFNTYAQNPSKHATINSPTITQCRAYILMREAGSEVKRAQKGVLDILANLERKYNKNACEVFKIKGIYPYAKYGVKHTRKDILTRLEELDRIAPVIPDSRYLYHNHVKHSFAACDIKISKIYFCRDKFKEKLR